MLNNNQTIFSRLSYYDSYSNIGMSPFHIRPFPTIDFRQGSILCGCPGKVVDSDDSKEVASYYYQFCVLVIIRDGS